MYILKLTVHIFMPEGENKMFTTTKTGSPNSVETIVFLEPGT